MKSVLIGLTFVTLMATSALSLTIPHGALRQPEGQHRYEDKVYAYSWVVVGADGQATATTLFSNSRKWEPAKRLIANIRIMSGEKLLAAHRFDQTMPDPGFKGTVESQQNASFSLTPDQWKSVTEIKYDYNPAPTPADCAFYKNKADNNSRLIGIPEALGCPR